MPKEPVKAFRKGTKSCVECRQRKLRCLPSDDETKPCQNCAARGRNCVLQVSVGRAGEGNGFTARDRISHLEGSVSQLWQIVGQLKTELGHQDLTPQHEMSPGAHSPDSEDEDTVAFNPPAHLQQLFDNECVDTQTPAEMSSVVSSDRTSNALTQKARSKLQSLLPSKDDIRALCIPSTMRWITVYASLFPTINRFNNADDILAHYDEVNTASVSPAVLACLLIYVTITLAQLPREVKLTLKSIPDKAQWMKSVDEAVGLLLIKQDELACSLEGVEASLLYLRLQFMTAQPRTLWLILRRVMALAEFIGLPRAAQRANAFSPTQAVSNENVSKYLRPTLLWKSICSIDRMIGSMFNLPFGTAAYGFPAPERVTVDGDVLYQEFFSYIAFIASKVQDVDEAYLSRRSEAEIIDKVYKVEQELRALSNMVPQDWWNVTDDEPIAAHILQFWFYYFTVRAHVQLALRKGADSSDTFSFMACYQASRTLAQRYVKLRTLLPPAFFAGRVLDLQALTGAVVCLLTSHQQKVRPGAGLQQEENTSSVELVEEVIQTMESRADQATGMFAKQSAPALRALTELLNKPGPVDSNNLALHVPMLGKINISRHAKPPAVQPLGQGRQQSWDSSQPALFPSTQQPYSTAPHPIPGAELSTSGFTSGELFPWSMDLMMDDLLPFTDNSFLSDHYIPWDTTGLQPRM